MRKRIRELAHGKIYLNEPTLIMSPDKISLEVLEGGKVSGEFSFHSDTDDVVRGNVYSSLARMECFTPVFDGRKITIRYEFNSAGLKEGDVLKGDFYIVSDHGEYNLSFVVSVLNPQADSSMGNIKNLDDFVDLYKNYPNEAFKIFYSSYFHHVLKNNSLYEHKLYEGLKGGSRSVSNIEEFLIELNLKKRIELHLTKNNYTFGNVSENCSEIVEIIRNTWGCLSIQISTDSDFIEFTKNEITDADFIGMTCYLPMVICADKLHAGKNFGKVKLSFGFWEEEVLVCASKTSDLSHESGKDTQKNMLFVALGRLYMDYRMGKIVTGKWSDKSISLLDELIAIEDIPYYHLMKAQLYLANGRKQNAEWIINDFKRDWDGTEDEIYGYYLYINTLYNKEESYVNKLIDKVNDLYIKNRESALLFFCILNLNSEYVKEKHVRYKAIKSFVEKYGHSYVLETEALYILLLEPYAITTLDSFTKRILLRADRYGYMDEKLCQRIVMLSERENGYDPVVRRLLESAQTLLGDEDSTTAVCAYLIKNQIFDDRAFPFYEKGIELNIRVAGIYEAYLESMDKRNITAIPHIMLMYFRAHSHLPYKEKAALFVKIIANKENDPDTYEDYKDQIVDFAYEQLDYGRIDDSLSVIYGDVFDNSIRLHEVADQLASVLFTHRITCFDDRYKYLVVKEYELKGENRVAIRNNVVYVNIYSDDKMIFLEDANGNRTAEKSLYQIEMLMPIQKYVNNCIKYASEEYAYLISYFKNKKTTVGADIEDIHMLERLLSDERTGDEFKNEIAMRFCKFLDDRGRADIVIRAVNFDIMGDDDRVKYVKLLIDNSVLETAYSYIREYNLPSLDMNYIYRVISYIIKEVDDEEDFELLEICLKLFYDGCKKPDLLVFLEKHAVGPSKNLEKILKVLRSEDLPRKNLTERVLVQSLFSTEYISSSMEVFEDYIKDGSKEVIDAYLTYQNHLAFSSDAVVSDKLFLYTKERILIDDNVPAVMKLSLAKHLTEAGELKEDEIKLISDFILDWIDRGLYFRFYKKLPHDLQEKLHIADQTIVEYKTVPRRRVKIHYRLNESDEYIVEDLQEMYYGTYVKHTVLFFGESMQYYITEDVGGHEETFLSGKVDNFGISGNTVTSRYDYLNELLMAYYLGENDVTKRLLKEYIKKTDEVKVLFELMG